MTEHWQIGRFSGGKLTGSGMMRMPDGAYYFGDFKEGKRHGAGMSVSGMSHEMRRQIGCISPAKVAKGERFACFWSPLLQHHLLCYPAIIFGTCQRWYARPAEPYAEVSHLMPGIAAASGIIYEGEFFNDLRDGCGCMWAKSGAMTEHVLACALVSTRVSRLQHCTRLQER